MICRLFIYIYLTLLFFGNGQAYGQQLIHGQVLDSTSLTPFPFTLLEINGGQEFYFSDIEGNFKVSIDDTLRSIRFIHPLASDDLNLNFNLNDTIHTPTDFYLNRKPIPDDLRSTNPETERLIRKVLKNKPENTPQNQVYEADIYSKYLVSSTNVPKPPDSSIFQKALSFFSIPLRGRKKDHLFLVESASKKKHLNRLNQYEEITGTRSTGLNVPSLYAYAIPLQYTSVYENYVNLASDPYVSPLAANPFKRYNFNIMYELQTGNDTLFIVQFNPKPRKLISHMKGFLYIDSRNYAVKYAILGDAIEGNLYLELAQQYDLKNENWIPEATTTTAIFQKKRPRPMVFTVQGKTYYNFRNSEEKKFRRKDFNENIRYYEPEVNEKPDSFWVQVRQIPLSESEEEAYTAYDSLGRDKKVETLLRLGERIYFGYIPVGKVNFDLNRILNYNVVEGNRIGLGFHTNEKFSRKYFLRSYVGYGLRDKRFKYGLDGAYFINGNPDNHLSIMHGRDLEEAGAVVFPYDLAQYSSESIRSFMLSIMDMNRTNKIAFGYSPFRYMKAQIALANIHSAPAYTYRFRDRPMEMFNLTEVQFGFRYAYGEQYILMSRQKIPVGSRFPIFWFLYTKGMDNFANGEFAYEKIDVKLQHTFRTIGFGTTGVQIISGMTTGDAPYLRLWNGRGAFRSPSIVIHNSFETMRLNEFLSDKYLAIFLSHNFGKIFSSDANFRPEFVVSHNMGWGTLRNPGEHEEIDFKTMEKGYFESGFFFNKLLLMNIAGLRTGLGFGMFFRYGPYRNRYFDNNLVLKMALTFTI
ncbi:MAG: DUF5686 family protein [Cytophagaceae bacterium]